MHIEQAIQQRIKDLFLARNLPTPILSDKNETTVDAIEQLCNQLGISLADFFISDLFRN